MRGCLGLFSLTLLSASRLAWSPRVPVFLRPHQIASGKADPGSIRVLFATVNSSPDSGRDQAGPSAWWVEKCSAPLATWGHFRSRGPFGRTPRKKRPRFCRRDSDLWRAIATIFPSSNTRPAPITGGPFKNLASGSLLRLPSAARFPGQPQVLSYSTSLGRSGNSGTLRASCRQDDRCCGDRQ